MKNSIKTLFFGGMMMSSGIQANAPQENLQVVQKLLSYGDVRAVDNMGEFFAETVKLHNPAHPEGKEYSLEEITRSEKERVATFLGQKWQVLDCFAFENLIFSYLLMHVPI